VLFDSAKAHVHLVFPYWPVVTYRIRRLAQAGLQRCRHHWRGRAGRL